MFRRFARKTLRYLTDLGRFGVGYRRQDCQIIGNALRLQRKNRGMGFGPSLFKCGSEAEGGALGGGEEW